MPKRGGQETVKKWGPARAWQKDKEGGWGGPIGRQVTRPVEAGGSNATLSCKAEAGEARTVGVRYGVGRSRPFALLRPKGIGIFFIYSNNFQISLN
jgi:hypothetical protein